MLLLGFGDGGVAEREDNLQQILAVDDALLDVDGEAPRKVAVCLFPRQAPAADRLANAIQLTGYAFHRRVSDEVCSMLPHEGAPVCSGHKLLDETLGALEFGDHVSELGQQPVCELGVRLLGEAMDAELVAELSKLALDFVV